VPLQAAHGTMNGINGQNKYADFYAHSWYICRFLYNVEQLCAPNETPLVNLSGPSRLRRLWQSCDFIEGDQKLRGPTLGVLERIPWCGDVLRLLETSAKRADVWKPISCDMPRCM
jgi:hypothetical protein